MEKLDVRKKWSESQSLPHATVEDLKYVPANISLDALNEYLADFLKPQENCWLCDKDLYVEWGLAHGMAHCSNCGIDTRVYHHINIDNGERVRFERSLQYHPKTYSLSEQE